MQRADKYKDVFRALERRLTRAVLVNIISHVAISRKSCHVYNFDRLTPDSRPSIFTTWDGDFIVSGLCSDNDYVCDIFYSVLIENPFLSHVDRNIACLTGSEIAEEVDLGTMTIDGDFFSEKEYNEQQRKFVASILRVDIADVSDTDMIVSFVANIPQLIQKYFVKMMEDDGPLDQDIRDDWRSPNIRKMIRTNRGADNMDTFCHYGVDSKTRDTDPTFVSLNDLWVC